MALKNAGSVALLPVLKDPAHSFHRPLHWRMNHRGQRALRDGRNRALVYYRGVYRYIMFTIR